jgi:hypothetical protein
VIEMENEKVELLERIENEKVELLERIEKKLLLIIKKNKIILDNIR